MSTEEDTQAADDKDTPPSDEGKAEQLSRYQDLSEDGARFVICSSMSEIRLWVERGLTVNEAGRKRFPQQTIFLDGVFSGAPFMDNKARQYSLDHHEGCVRAFTLATCEQAAVMILQGLPLEAGQWQIYINEPDMDSLLAAWILLNHAELMSDGAALLREAMPLIRVEGLIDAHGLQMEPLSALSQDLYEEKRQQLDLLRLHEKSHKNTNTWATIDFTEYCRDLLHALDTQLFPGEFLEELRRIVEVKHLTIQGQKMAIFCRSRQGIYQVEALLKERHEKQVGLIILEKTEGHFTLRLVDRFLDKNLRNLYEILNQRDPRANQTDDSDNLWGGADDIGGSPRKTGSAIPGEEILRLAQRVYGKPEGWIDRMVKRIRP